MVTLHFYPQPQYKYELFYRHFTSFHCTGRYELDKLTSLPMCGFIAQLVEDIDKWAESAAVQHQWFPRHDTPEHAAYDKRKPGLFKVEWKETALWVSIVRPTAAGARRATKPTARASARDSTTPRRRCS